MSGANAKVRLGPNGRPIRHFEMPNSFAGRMSYNRYRIARRLVQFTVLLLFFGTAHWGWEIAGQPLLLGNLSSSELLGVIPMADPFATMQIVATGFWPMQEALIGAGLILLFYALLGGRTWCSWVCPINPVTDATAWLRRRIGSKDILKLRRWLRYVVLGLALVLSMITGLAAFEWVSPISMLHRELIFGLGFGWAAVLGVVVFDLFVLKDGWCGHLCPLGAFYALVGKVAVLRVHFDAPTCTHCGDCASVCPEPQVLNLKQAAEYGRIRSGECTNCGNCITVCPEDSLSFDIRRLNADRNLQKNMRRTL